ncbi:hypothetical protein R5R35_008625 [Gryllus longicercus]|uniref:Uncharacterized protein n=1 Tax=Gryllus longicercus TaxID=2509291 RepID=A0AAN9VPJ9_9ORTH
MKRLKAPDCMSSEEILEENCSKKITKVKKLVTTSQPILRYDQKIKLNAILSNWKPPLKNKPNESHDVCDLTDIMQQSEMKVLNCEDTLIEAKQVQKISPSYFAELKFNQVESSFSKDNYHVNSPLVQKSPQQHQGSCNAQPSTSSETPSYETHMTNTTFDFNDQKTKDILVCDINASEVKIKNKNSDSESQENSPNEKVNIPYCNASTPEVARTPPTPPTLKVSFLNSNVGYDLSPNNLKKLTPNEACEEQPNLIEKSPNKSKTYNEAELLKNENVNSNKLPTETMKSEVSTLTKYSASNACKTESEHVSNISYSQLDSIENNPSTSTSQRELMQDINFPREVAQELNPSRELAQDHHLSREFAQDIKNSDFIPFHLTALTPKMPRINWVRQLQEDKRQLQVVVREISQLNAMLTRAIREIWPARPLH